MHKLLLILLTITFINLSAGAQKFIFNNRDFGITVISANQNDSPDSLKLEVTFVNTSAESVFIPKNNFLELRKSKSGRLWVLNFGMDVKYFREARFIVQEIKPKGQLTQIIYLNNKKEDVILTIKGSFVFGSENKPAKEESSNQDINVSNWMWFEYYLPGFP